MKPPPDNPCVTLTHYGRRSGKPFEVDVWYVVVGDEVWVGSLDASRNWVRNVRAAGRAELDFGGGSEPYTARWEDDPSSRARFAQAIRVKHPLRSRLLSLLVRGRRPALFRMSSGDTPEVSSRR